MMIQAVLSNPSHLEYGVATIPCCLMVSAIRSRWGQRLGQKKAASENSNL